MDLLFSNEFDFKWICFFQMSLISNGFAFFKWICFFQMSLLSNEFAFK